ncbi:MAG: cytochrome P450 [Acidimicrobiales bacterium]
MQALLQPPFKASGRSGPFVADELAALADSILDDVAGPTFDVMSAYAQPLAAGSLATVLGLGEYGLDTMWSWCEGLCADIANFENDSALAAKGERAKRELGEAISRRIDEAGDDDSAISVFVRNGATNDEIINNVRLAISGGINEPRDGIGLVTYVLLTRPDLRQRVEQEPAKLKRLIEETLRVYSPVGTVTRQATQDIRLGGVTIPAGALVAGVLRSVNLDESHWSNPRSIDLDRREGPHAAFALGVHRCLGEWLGRQEIRVGVERLFARFPDIALVDGADVDIVGFEFRGPRCLVVAT